MSLLDPPALSTSAAKKLAPSFVAATGAPVGLTSQPLVFDRANGGAPVFSASAQNPVAGATASPTIYWPWIVDAKRMFGPSALDEFYLYYSTDHEAIHANSGIWVATGPTELGPWTSRGRVYRDDAGGAQTETPTVFADPTGVVKAIMLYQQESVPGSIGVQSTCYATSSDGITWTRGGTAIDIPTWWPSDGHTGYARVAQIGGALYSHHLAGGNNTPTFGISTSVDGRIWNLSPAPLHFGMGLLGDGRRIEWNSGNVVRWRGQLWWIGMTSDFVSGSTPKDGRLAAAPISPDLRQLLAPPSILLYPTGGTETTNYRSLYSFVTREGRLVMYYQCGNDMYAATAREVAP